MKSRATSEVGFNAAASVSTAHEIAKLAQLHDAGEITVPEHDKLKAKILV